MSSKSRASTAAPPHANLYCASCNSQIGIFENNWSHLTSSYAYPKEKGTDFGTQTGTNTQIVPHGTKDTTATGCAMAQVFCKKCSALLGQCCKSAPRPEQKHLVNLVFYKVSRTFLKDAQTFASLDFNFPDDADSPADYDPSTSLSQRSSAKPQPRRSSGMAPPYTPLRDSLPPATSQPQSFQPMHPPAWSMQSATPASARPRSSAGAADVTQEIAEHGQTMSDYSQQLKLVETRVSRSVFRLNELEEKVDALGKRRAFAVKQVDDQAAELEQHALQLSEHEGQSQTSKEIAENHERRLLSMESQLDAIKVNMVEMKAMFKGQPTSRINSLGNNNFVDGLEAMLQAFKNTQAPTSEIEVLKQENRMLKERLDTMTQAMGTVSNDDTLTLNGRTGHSTNTHAKGSFGKRKRLSTRADSRPRKSNSRRVSSRIDTAAEQELSTPLSDQVGLKRKQKRTEDGTSRSHLDGPALAGPYFGATLFPPMAHTDTTENLPAEQSNVNVPENIDFSDDDELLPNTDHNAQQINGLANGVPSTSRPASSGADQSHAPPLPASIRDAIRNLNGRTPQPVDVADDVHRQVQNTLPKSTISGRRPVPPGKHARVRQTPVHSAPDTPNATRPASRGRGRLRKSLPVLPANQSTSSSTGPISISKENTPASSSEDNDEELFEGQSEDNCTICGKGGKLLCCDTCPKVYHHRCLVPKLNPKLRIKGDWHCPACVGKPTATKTTSEPEQRHASTETKSEHDTSAADQVLTDIRKDGIANEVADKVQQAASAETSGEQKVAETAEEGLARREILVSDIMRREEQALQDAISADQDNMQLEAPAVAVIEV